MTRVEDFGNHLFSILANIFIFDENPDSSTEKPDTSEKKLGSGAENFEDSDSENISRSVLMLSYVYRFAFRQRFIDERTILMRAERNPLIYVRCFAEVLHEKYSPLKFLIVCSFISEIFLCFSNDHVLKRKRYVQRTTEALKDVFQNIFENDFPQNRWTDIRNEASEIAKGFPYLEPFMTYEKAQFGKMDSLEMASTITRKIFDDQNESQPVDTAMVEAQQERVNVNIPAVPSSQVMANVPVTEVPIPSPDGLPTNQTVNLLNSENLMYPPAYPVSFGTVDQDPQLLNLLQFSGYQTESVTFENEPFGTEPNFQNVVETAEPFNIESRSQENLAARSLEDGPEPSSRTVTPTENGTSEHCAEDNTITSDEEQFLVYILSSESEDESGPFFFTDKKTEEESKRSIADNAIISVQESMDAGENDPESATLSAESDSESATLTPESDSESATLTPESDSESATLTPESDSESATLTPESDPERATESDPEGATLSTESDPESATLSTENDPERGTFSKEDSYGGSSNDTATLSTEENVSYPENATFSNEKNFNDPESETFSKEDTMANGSAVNVLEN